MEFQLAHSKYQNVLRYEEFNVNVQANASPPIFLFVMLSFILDNRNLRNSRNTQIGVNTDIFTIEKFATFSFSSNLGVIYY